MILSEKNANILMQDLHRAIDNYAESTVSMLVDIKDDDSLFYPPGSKLSTDEMEALRSISDTEHLESGLRKILVDNGAGIVFHLFNLIDGTVDPANDENSEWRELQLIDREQEEHREVVGDFLHDLFLSSFRR